MKIDNFPDLTPIERRERNVEHRGKALAFLASETWSNISTIAMLLTVSTYTAGRLLRALASDSLAVREDIPIGPRAMAVVTAFRFSG